MNASGEAAKGLVMNRVEMQPPRITQSPLMSQCAVVMIDDKRRERVELLTD